MLVDLVRHGVAVPTHDLGDAHRALAPEGRAAIQRLGARLAQEPERPLRVWASPLVRARETADLLARALGLTAAVEIAEWLEPETDPAETIARLDRSSEAHLMLVSHQPLAGRLAGRWLGRDNGFAPGELLRLECPRPFEKASARLLLRLVPDR